MAVGMNRGKNGAAFDGKFQEFGVGLGRNCVGALRRSGMTADDLA